MQAGTPVAGPEPRSFALFVGVCLSSWFMSSRPPSTSTTTFASPSGGYALHSDLARLSLPQTFQDSGKWLAWLDSILLLFLTVGLVGLYEPKIFEKPLSKPNEVVPVVFTPPDEPPPPSNEPPPPEEAPPDQPADQPVVLTVVAPANAKVAFSIPVQGAVAVASEVRFATPPPRSQKVAAPQPTAFNYRTARGGRFPDPTYPRSEMMQRHQGRITLYVVVDAAGVPTTVEVRDSCGWPSLDSHAAKWVQENWRWEPGETRYLLAPIIYQMR